MRSKRRCRLSMPAYKRDCGCSGPTGPLSGLSCGAKCKSRCSTPEAKAGWGRGPAQSSSETSNHKKRLTYRYFVCPSRRTYAAKAGPIGPVQSLTVQELAERREVHSQGASCHQQQGQAAYYHQLPGERYHLPRRAAFGRV